jgi:hypothetical protein
MVKIEISNETADSLIRDILVNDYRSLINDIAKLESNLPNLKPFELEDLDNDRTFVEGFKIILKYYLTYDEYTELFNETTNCQ